MHGMLLGSDTHNRLPLNRNQILVEMCSLSPPPVEHVLNWSRGQKSLILSSYTMNRKLPWSQPNLMVMLMTPTMSTPVFPTQHLQQKNWMQNGSHHVSNINSWNHVRIIPHKSSSEGEMSRPFYPPKRRSVWCTCRSRHLGSMASYPKTRKEQTESNQVDRGIYEFIIYL